MTFRCCTLSSSHRCGYTTCEPCLAMLLATYRPRKPALPKRVAITPLTCTANRGLAEPDGHAMLGGIRQDTRISADPVTRAASPHRGSAAGACPDAGVAEGCAEVRRILAVAAVTAYRGLCAQQSSPGSGVMRSETGHAGGAMLVANHLL